MPTFEFHNAEEVGRVFKRHNVKYLFFGKAGAILLGYSDTTQDVAEETCEIVLRQEGNVIPA